MRIGVGAAVVLLLAALATAVVISAVGGQATHRVISPGGSGQADGSGRAGGSGQAGGSGGSGGTSPGGTSSGASSANADQQRPTSAPGAIIFVHVFGAVRRPGLFELSAGARVIDAVAAAGGLTETADPAGANLARRLSDGEQLYLPEVGEVPAGPPAASGGASGVGAVSGQKVNLNTATAAELDTLPRIGPLMAQRIIDYRDVNGPFAAVDDLRNVTGIGDKTFDGLKELVTV